jgi:hypothetical protein
MKLSTLLLSNVVILLHRFVSAETGFASTCISSDTPSKQQREWGMKACLTSMTKLSTCADNLKKGTYASTNIGNSVAVISQSSNTQTLTSLEAMHWCQTLVGYCVDGQVQCDTCSTSLYIYQLASLDGVMTAGLTSTGDIAEAPVPTHVVSEVSSQRHNFSETTIPTTSIQERPSTIDSRADPQVCRAPGTSLATNSFCSLKIVAYSLAENRVWKQKHSGTLVAALNSIMSQFQEVGSQTGQAITPILSAYTTVEDGSNGDLGTLTITMETYNNAPWNVVLQNLQNSVDPSANGYYAAANAVIGVFGAIRNYVQDTRTQQTGYGFDIANLNKESLFTIFISKTLEGKN